MRRWYQPTMNLAFQFTYTLFYFDIYPLNSPPPSPLTFNTSKFIDLVFSISGSHPFISVNLLVAKKLGKKFQNSGAQCNFSSTLPPLHAQGSRFSGSETIARWTSCNTEASFSLWHAIHSTFLSPFPRLDAAWTRKGIPDAKVSCIVFELRERGGTRRIFEHAGLRKCRK